MVYLQGRAETPTTARPLAAASAEPTSRLRAPKRTLAHCTGGVEHEHFIGHAVIHIALSTDVTITNAPNGRDDSREAMGTRSPSRSVRDSGHTPTVPTPTTTSREEGFVDAVQLLGRALRPGQRKLHPPILQPTTATPAGRIEGEVNLRGQEVQSRGRNTRSTVKSHIAAGDWRVRLVNVRAATDNVFRSCFQACQTVETSFHGAGRQRNALGTSRGSKEDNGIENEGAKATSESRPLDHLAMSSSTPWLLHER